MLIRKEEKIEQLKKKIRELNKKALSLDPQQKYLPEIHKSTVANKHYEKSLTVQISKKNTLIEMIEQLEVARGQLNQAPITKQSLANLQSIDNIITQNLLDINALDKSISETLDLLDKSAEDFNKNYYLYNNTHVSNERKAEVKVIQKKIKKYIHSIKNIEKGSLLACAVKREYEKKSSKSRDKSQQENSINLTNYSIFKGAVLNTIKDVDNSEVENPTDINNNNNSK